MKTLKATASYQPFHYKNVEVRLFGKNVGTTDWNIACLNDPTAQTATDESRECLARIHSIASEAGVSRLYAPRPTEFNAEVCHHGSLRTSFSLGTPYPCTESPSFFTLYRGVNADGCDVPKQSGFWMSTADCPTIVAYCPTGKLICSHAGRDCLFDRKYLLGESSKPRQYNSVVDAIFARMEEMGSPMSHLQFFITCGISGENFDHPWDHPKHGDKNRKIVEHLIEKWGQRVILGDPNQGQIKLHRLITTQLLTKRIDLGNIIYDGIDTFADKQAGEHRWWSTRRGDAKQRNGVLVIHR